MKIIDSKLKFRSNLVKRSETTTIVLHHAEARKASVQDIHSWHLANGWAGIGYHYYVRKDGTVYQGRPEWALGSHCKGSNFCSIGICCEGDYEKYDKTMPTKQYNALVGLINDIKSRYTGATVKGHGELYPTACPGKYYPLDTIKKLFNKNVAMDLNTTIGLQTALRRLGFYQGAIDGIAGPKTVEAIRGFQAKYGLVVDGVVGPNTRNKIKEVLK